MRRGERVGVALGVAMIVAQWSALAYVLLTDG